MTYVVCEVTDSVILCVCRVNDTEFQIAVHSVNSVLKIVIMKIVTGKQGLIMAHTQLACAQNPHILVAPNKLKYESEDLYSFVYSKYNQSRFKFF